MRLAWAKGSVKGSGSVRVWYTSAAHFDSKIRSMGRVFNVWVFHRWINVRNKFIVRIIP